jgi:hypothetical protein
MSDPSRTERRLLASIRTAKAGGEASTVDSPGEATASADVALRPVTSQRPSGRTAEVSAARAEAKRTGDGSERISSPADKYQSPGRIWPD